MKQNAPVPPALTRDLGPEKDIRAICKLAFPAPLKIVKLPNEADDLMDITKDSSSVSFLNLCLVD